VDKVLEDGNERAVDKSSVDQYAENIGAYTFETSAKTGTNVENLFFKIAEDFVQKGATPLKNYDAVPLDSPNNADANSCPC